MSKPTVFISYSHLDEEWKDRLVRHLAVAQQQGQLELWHDRMIGAGEDWERQIQAAMDAASVAILLVSANSLTSEFILREEVSRLLERRASEGLRIFPIVIKPCDWGAVDWVRRMNLRPKDGKPLSGGNEHEIDLALAEIAREIRELLKRTAPPVTPTFVPLNPDEISTSRLPRLLTPHLFGRDDELQLLDKAWADPHMNIVTFVAWGGVGKSALVSHWLMRLEQENYRGAERVYAWSFYSQGTSDHAATADYFINDALRWFGGDALADQLATTSPWEKGERLARLIRQTRTLLILDGLEPVQHPPGPQEGRLKEQSLQALLRELAAQQPGLCIISTREAVGDLTQYEGRTVVRHVLTNLSPQAGAQLLRELKIKGPDAELEAAAREYGGHSLALTLLGSYLGDVYAGDVRRRHEIENLEDDVRHGWQVRRMMRAYEKWLGGRQELAMLDVLRLLGLFDRPADKDSIKALRAAPPIPGLTDSLFRYERKKRWFGLSTSVKAEPISAREWQKTVSSLRRIHLLAEVVESAPDTLDAHPLVREHFRAQLKAERPVVWQTGHLRLYLHLKHTTKKLPDTMEEMEPLYLAMHHACQAGLHLPALLFVYMPRISRWNEGFSTDKLHMYSAELAMVQSFFIAPWHQPIADLTKVGKAAIMDIASHSLRALGRFKEVEQLLLAQLEIQISSKKWINAMRCTQNLSECYLAMGNLPQSLFYAKQGMDMAIKRRYDIWQTLAWAAGGRARILTKKGYDIGQITARATFADVLHQAGCVNDAETVFREAEAIFKQKVPGAPTLAGVQGFHYCDLLLGLGKYQEVHNRATKAIKLREAEDLLLENALDHLSLGRALLLKAMQPPQLLPSPWDTDTESETLSKAEKHLDIAVTKLRQASVQEFLLRALLARAAWARGAGQFDRAQSDLAEAFTIAERGEMRLHLCDCHLESARLSLATGDHATARKAWETAKAMIEEMGYHRRDGEVAEIEAQLNAAGE